MHPTLSRVLDFIYPAQCQICEDRLTHGRHLCDTCKSQLSPVEAPFCSKCGECFDGQLTDTFFCPNCHDLTFAFEFARAALKGEGEARELIHDFKYLRQIHLAPELGRLAMRALDDPRFAPYQRNGILVPVPLFWKRQRMRRFNQSEQIARHLSKYSGIPALNALKRTRHTETQTRFSRAKRLKNLKGAFAFNSKYHDAIANTPVILIDDVFTTGSTAHECAKVLIENGALSVSILTILRG